MSIRQIVYDLPYDSWKSNVQAGSLSVAHVDSQRDNRPFIYAGSGAHVLRAVAAGPEYSDWDTNFSSSSTAYPNEDAAIVALITETSNGSVPVVVVSGYPIGWKQYPDQWANTPIDVANGSWTTVYTLTGDEPALIEAQWHLNTTSMHLRFEVDGEVLGSELDLYELEQNFRLDGTGGGGNEMPSAAFMYYAHLRWQFKPSVPMRASSQIKIQMKASAANKKVERGLSFVERKM